MASMLERLASGVGLTFVPLFAKSGTTEANVDASMRAGVIDQTSKGLWVHVASLGGSVGLATEATLLAVKDVLENIRDAYFVALLERFPAALVNGRLAVDTNDAAVMTPLTGNSTATNGLASPLNAANGGTSKVGWYVRNESTSNAMRVSDASVNATQGFYVGPGQTHTIPSSKLDDHYAAGVGADVAFSVFGEA